jgi:hypothetical protein
VREEEIIDIIYILDSNKATGSDKISNKMNISIKNKIAKPLCLLFKKSLRLKKYLRSWKIAHVIPLFKNGDKSLPSNYRPVSLLSCASTIFDIKINFYANSNQVLSLAFRLLTNYLRYITLF